MFIDPHAHLQIKNFDSDREEVIERANAAGIGKIINVGFDVEGNFKALALAQKYDFMYLTMGIHPHLASEWNEEVGSKIVQAIKKEGKIVAIGEIGLDYFKNFQPVDLQKQVLREQLRLARKIDMPVIIHCRNAYEDLFTILEEEDVKKVLLHCFTGTMEEAREGLSKGYLIAFTGVITYPSAENLLEVLASCPLDRILLETDCPYLPPQSKRGKRNEPAFLTEIIQKAAQIKRVRVAELERVLEENVKSFFGI